MMYILSCIIPIFIFITLVIALKGKVDVLKLFTDGVLQGLKICLNIFPYIFAITVAIGILKDTSVIDKIIIPFEKIIVKFGIPKDIVPLIFLRPLSGSASTAMAMEIFEKSGPDSKSGNIASLLMGCTETTFYSLFKNIINYGYTTDYRRS